jgi:hypothetical protein
MFKSVDVKFVAMDRHKNVVRLNQLMKFQPSPLDTGFPTIYTQIPTLHS